MGRPSKQKRVAFSRGSAVISVLSFQLCILPYSMCSCNDTKFSYPKLESHSRCYSYQAQEVVNLYLFTTFQFNCVFRLGNHRTSNFGVMAQAVRDIN